MKKNLYYLAVLMVSIAVFAACNDEATNESGIITVEDESVLHQTVYADSEQLERPITFTTNGAWTTEVSGSSWERPLDEVSDNQSDHFEWATLIPGSGQKGGTHTIEVHLEKNTSGYSRSIDRKSVV